MASTDLVMDIYARDHASATFGRVARSADHAHSRISRMGTLGRALPIAAVTAFGIASVKAFSEAEAKQSSLESAYKRFPKLHNANIESLRALNTAMQKKTKFDDDDLASMQARLAVFNLTGQQIKTLTPLIADYAQVTGKDLNSSATAVGKALMGNLKALKSLGIDYKLTGNKAKDAARIQQLLAEKTKGAAEAFGQTSAGKIAIFNNQLGDLKEKVGESLIPALNTLVEGITPIADAFGKLPAPVRTGAIAVTGLAVAYNFLSPALGGVKGAISGIARIFGTSTAATVADTVATNANTAAHVANGKVGGTVPGSFMRGGKSAAAGGLGVAEGAAGMGTGAFLAGLTVAIAAAIGATYVGTKEAAKHHAEQAPGVSGAAAGGIRYAGPSATDTQNVKARADAQFRLNDAIKSGVPNIDQQSQSYVKSSKAVGASTEGIKQQLKQMGLTPRQIETAFKANPTDLNTKLKRAKGDLNGLKQSRVPAIRAQASQLNSQLKAAQANVNRLKQKDPTNLKAIDRASAKVQAIMNKIADLHDKDITITTTYTTYVNAVKGRAPATSHGGRATGGAGGGLVKVGERGPELVALPEGAWVFTHSQSAAMSGVPNFASGGGSKAQKAKLAAINTARANAYSTTRSNTLTFGTVGGYDFGDSASALDEQQQAQREYNLARGIGERAQALERLAAANKKVAASKPSASNVIGAFRAKLASIQSFGSVLGQLRSKLGKKAVTAAGKAILNTVLDAGPEQGTLIGQSLLQGNGIWDALRIEGDIINASGYLGMAAADVSSGKYIKPHKAATKSTAKQTVNVIVKIDKKVVAQSLLELKREQGGKPLGLS